ncbi:hypothetical protein LT875_002507 [Salmonella enterica]|nr:hypothetical protein [Salmonella enterica]
MNNPIEPEDMPEALEKFAETSELAKSDATEWLIFHTYLIDPETGRCGISPPMLALTWDMALTVFNALMNESLANMSERYDRAYFARIENSPEQLRVGVFAKMGEGYPVEGMMLMDRRHLTLELYKQFYEHDATGETTVVEMGNPSCTCGNCGKKEKQKAVLH